MNVSVKTFEERLPEVIEALEKNERVIISHKGKKLGVLQSMPKRDKPKRNVPKRAVLKSPAPERDIEAEIEKFKNLPGFGMWADREDMKDPNAWRAEQRRKHRERKFGHIVGEKE